MSAKRQAAEVATPIAIPSMARYAFACADREEGRYAIHCAELRRRNGRAEMVTTNGKMLAHLAWDDNGEDIAPFVVRVGEMEKLVKGSQEPLLVYRSDSTLSLTPVRGKARIEQFSDPSSLHFPPWDAVLPKPHHGVKARIRVSVEALAACASLFAGDVGCKMRIKGGDPRGLVALAHSVEDSKWSPSETIAAPCNIRIELSAHVTENNDECYEFGMNPVFLYRTARAVGANEVTLEFRSPVDALVVLPGDGENGTSIRHTFGLVMPINLT